MTITLQQALAKSPATSLELRKLTGLTSVEIMGKIGSELEIQRGKYGRMYLKLKETNN